jgi:glycerol-3-phosphate dehydrogenase (NAD(P)+)
LTRPGFARVAVLGAGAWGTALALALRRANLAVTLWARDAEAVARMRKTGENSYALPGVRLDAGLVLESDLLRALGDAQAVLLAVPAQSLRSALPLLAGRLAPDVPLVLCAKGIELATGKRLSAVVREFCPANPVASLSGPSFAADVGRGLPTAVVVAAAAEPLAAALARAFSSESFRCYSSGDLAGVEIGGALKNVFAIAAGAARGAGLGASAEAALVTRGFVELRRLAESFGARPETPLGLSGLGDLALTCASPQSRNFACGMALGRGEALEGRPLAEGVATAAIAARIAAERGIEAPIVTAAAAILAGKLSIRAAVAGLMTRPLKSEGL